MMRKILIGVASAALSLTVLSTPAIADPNIPPEDLNTNAKVEIFDESGVHNFDVKVNGQTLSQFLQTKGLDLNQYRYGDNKALDGTNVLEDNEIAKIYKISAEGKSEVVDLPFNTVEEKTDTLLLGESKVKEEGEAGKILKTVVTTGLNGSDVKTSQETIIVLEAPKPKTVLIGTKTPEKIVEEQTTQGVSAPSSNKEALSSIKESNSNNSLVSVLTAQVGKPYVWGSEGPDTFDCSGLVYYVMNKSGISLPRLTASGYGAQAKKIELKDIQPGDIFWNSGHIAIYAGNGKVIHAANPRVGVIVTNLSYFTSGDYNLARLS